MTKVKLTTKEEINNFLDECYSEDSVPMFEDYKKIFNSFKKFPTCIHPEIHKLKFSTDKHGMAFYVHTEGYKYSVEFQENYCYFYKQTAPRSRVFEPLTQCEYHYVDLLEDGVGA